MKNVNGFPFLNQHWKIGIEKRPGFGNTGFRNNTKTRLFCCSATTDTTTQLYTWRNLHSISTFDFFIIISSVLMRKKFDAENMQIIWADTELHPFYNYNNKNNWRNHIKLLGTKTAKPSVAIQISQRKRRLYEMLLNWWTNNYIEK